MEVKIKVVGAYYTPEGIVADSVNHPKYAEYRVEESENTYQLYVTADYAPAAISVRVPLELGEKDTVFMNGYQSATDSKEYSLTEKMTGIDMVSAYARRLYAEMVGGDYSIVRYKNKPGIIHGFS